MDTAQDPSRLWTRPEKLACRRLYLVSGLSPSEIATKLHRSSVAISCMVSRNGWAKQRRQVELKAATRADEQAAVVAREFNESVAMQAQELSEGGFKLARGAVDTGDAKGFVMAAQGTKVMVQLARMALGMDATGSAQPGTAQPLAIVFWRPPGQQDARPGPIDVTPETDIAPDLDFA